MLTANWQELFNALDYIHDNFDVGVMNEPNKVRTLLLDLAPGAKKESKVFLNILSEQELIKRIQSSQDVSFDYVVQQIEDLSGLAEDWAINVTEAIFRGCGIVVSKPLKTVPVTQVVSKPTTTPKKKNPGAKLFGRLAVGEKDVSATQNSAEQFNNPVVLPMPNKTTMKFEFIENSSWDGEYFIVSRDESPDSIVFYIFKDPDGTANPPVFIPEGKKIKKIYRAFMEKHKDEYNFTDEAKMQPNIQIRKADQPRGFLESTASGMFGTYLSRVIEIPPKYTYIGGHVFKYADTSYSRKVVEKIIVPNTVQRIEDFAFSDITAKVIVVPNSVTDIGFLAFCLSSDGYIECEEGSHAYKYARDNRLRTSVDIINEYKQLGRCQHCGGTFKKKMFQGLICENCGRTKDY